jgi:hypothetical protein
MMIYAGIKRCHQFTSPSITSLQAGIISADVHDGTVLYYLGVSINEGYPKTVGRFKMDDFGVPLGPKQT